MRESGGIRRHPGHGPTKDAELRHAHLRVGGIQVVDDRIRDPSIHGIDEERAPRCDRVVVRILRRVHLRVTRRLDHVDDRGGQRPERCDRALPCLNRAGVAKHPEDDELAVVHRRHERHRRRRHYVGDRAELFGRRLGQADEALDDLGRGRQHQHPADDRADLVQAVLKARRDAKVAAAAAYRPEKVRVRLGIDAQQLSIGGHDVRGEEVIDRQPVLAREITHATAQRDPADSHGPRIAEAGREAVLIGGDRVLSGGQAGLGPRCARCRIDLERVHVL